jgi:hypothetical protein
MSRQKRMDDAVVARLRPKATRYAKPDREMRGHYVRVATTGAKSFWVVARDPAGKQPWRKVGEPPMRLAEARKHALKVITSIRGAAPNSFKATAAPIASFTVRRRGLAPSATLTATWSA